MKVRCIKIYNEITKKYQEESSWLTIGKEYIILEVFIHPEKEILYRLVGNNKNKMPALYDARQFEILSGFIPKNWIIKQLSSGRIIFSPGAWREPGFWEKCYDYEPIALEIYRREARIIYEEESL